MKTIKVKCTFTIPIEIPDDPEYNATFDIEENHCPGTGIVGAAIDARIKYAEKNGICWACGLDDSCEIVS